MQFEDIFDAIFSSCDLGYMKEDSTFFTTLLDKLSRVKPQEILYFDDHTTKLAAAKKVGINIEQYTMYEDFQSQMKKYRLA